jgi:signal transduction histidine kinase
MEEILRLRIAGGDDAPARARATIAVRPELAGVEDSAALLVSELVANSVKHAAAQEIELNLLSDPKRIRVEVVDRGPGFDPFVSSEPEHDGFGLYVVDKFADRWGVETGAATRIWVELARTAPSPQDSSVDRPAPSKKRPVRSR